MKKSLTYVNKLTPPYLLREGSRSLVSRSAKLVTRGKNKSALDCRILKKSSGFPIDASILVCIDQGMLVRGLKEPLQLSIFTSYNVSPFSSDIDSSNIEIESTQASQQVLDICLSLQNMLLRTCTHKAFQTWSLKNRNKPGSQPVQQLLAIKLLVNCWSHLDMR